VGQPSRITDQLAPRIQRNVERLGLQAGHKLSWELLVNFGQPTPGQAPNFYGLLILTEPSPILGQNLMSLTQFVIFGVTDEALEGFVRQGLANLEAERAKALAAPQPTP